MPEVVIVTDSTASLPEEMYGRYRILMLPYYVHFADRVARNIVDIKPPEISAYLSALPDGARLPLTANPGPGDYQTAFRGAAERGSEIISFHLSARGSGAYQAALIGKGLAQQELRGVNIHVVDTLNVSMCHGWIALQAARAASDGASASDVMDLVRRMIPVARMIQTADTLRYLYMGGRIGRAKHLVGSVLQIKPLISMEDGEIVTLGVARTRTGAYQRMATLVSQAVGLGTHIRVALTHAAARADCEHLLGLVKKLVTPVEVLFCELCPALTVHSGPGTVGLCCVPERV